MASDADNDSGQVVNKTHGLDLLLIELESTDSSSVGLVLRSVSFNDVNKSVYFSHSLPFTGLFTREMIMKHL